MNHHAFSDALRNCQINDHCLFKRGRGSASSWSSRRWAIVPFLWHPTKIQVARCRTHARWFLALLPAELRYVSFLHVIQSVCLTAAFFSSRSMIRSFVCSFISVSVRCSIREEFRADTFELHKHPNMRETGRSWKSSPRGFTFQGWWQLPWP